MVHLYFDSSSNTNLNRYMSLYCQKPKACYIGPDGKVHGANIGPTWVLSAHEGPKNLVMGVFYSFVKIFAMNEELESPPDI